MTLYFLLKYLHVLGAIVILGTGTGIAFFMLMAHRSRDVAFIARTAATVVVADMLFTLTAVLLQPVTGGTLMMLSSTAVNERWLMASLGLYAVAGLFWVPVIFMQIEMRDLARAAVVAGAAAAPWCAHSRRFRSIFRPPSGPRPSSRSPWRILPRPSPGSARDPGEANGVTWDLMQEEPVTLGGVIDQFRRAFGTGEWPRIAMPAFLLDLGARLGDLANLLGWTPPMRTTAIAELRRGVSGNPARWMTATGIVPKTIAQMAGKRPATIQDKWFARLFPIKALMIASLVLFWAVSGFIALVISYDAAAGILSSHGFPPSLVGPITVGTSVMDMGIGVLIAFRRTSAFGLIAGIVASLGYMVGAAILTPDLWIEPLGALVKTGPAIVLMLVALLTLDNR